MVVNFRIFGISRDEYKLSRIPTLIKKIKCERRADATIGQQARCRILCLNHPPAHPVLFENPAAFE
jgi:hypothetical protein